MKTSDALVPAAALTRFSEAALSAIGCAPATAAEVAAHLVEADLMGVYSHGTVRLPQYKAAAEEGLFTPSATAIMTRAEGGAPLADGRGGFGMPACRLAAEAAIEEARAKGVGAAGVANVGHTGRMGASRRGAGRLPDHRHRQRRAGGVAPGRPVRRRKGHAAHEPLRHLCSGRRERARRLRLRSLGRRGGKVLAAATAGHDLAPGLITDRAGAPSTDPQDYLAGGALLPAAGPKGYAMALVAD